MSEQPALNTAPEIDPRIEPETLLSADDPNASSARSGDRLLDAENQSSSTARNNWIFFLSVLTYLFVAVASVTHKDLLLDAPVKLPLLGIEIALSRFFTFAPLFVLFVHAGLLLQHRALADKAREFDARISAEEARNGNEPRSYPQRLELSTYFLTQSIAGARTEWWRRSLLEVVVWGTLGVFPGLLLIFFQISYLPYHDEDVTQWHQTVVALEAVLSALFLFGMTKRQGSRQRLVRLSTFWSFCLFQAFIGLFAIFVATVPDSYMDKVTRSWTFPWQPVVIDDRNASRWAGEKRLAFRLTALFFEDDIDFGRGKRTNLFSFSRSLVVPNASPEQSRRPYRDYRSQPSRSRS
jgi:hypothetical protein